jgi:phosphate/sulfate permease
MFVIPFIGPRYREGDNETGQSSSLTDKESISSSSRDEISTENVEIENKHFFKVLLAKFGKMLQHGVDQEVADYEASRNREMHEVATKYDNDTEQLYSFLQIMTGSFASFAHGANDVSNSIGPLSTIYLIHTTGTIDATGSTDVPVKLLALGGAAIDVGLLFYGYHVMRSLGNKFTYHSPSRGFAMELGTSLTVLSASRFGMLNKKFEIYIKILTNLKFKLALTFVFFLKKDFLYQQLIA